MCTLSFCDASMCSLLCDATMFIGELTPLVEEPETLGDGEAKQDANPPAEGGSNGNDDSQEKQDTSGSGGEDDKDGLNDSAPGTDDDDEDMQLSKPKRRSGKGCAAMNVNCLNKIDPGVPVKECFTCQFDVHTNSGCSRLVGDDGYQCLDCFLEERRDDPNSQPCVAQGDKCYHPLDSEIEHVPCQDCTQMVHRAPRCCVERNDSIVCKNCYDKDDVAGDDGNGNSNSVQQEEKNDSEDNDGEGQKKKAASASDKKRPPKPSLRDPDPKDVPAAASLPGSSLPGSSSQEPGGSTNDGKKEEKDEPEREYIRICVSCDATMCTHAICDITMC
jgi:hypothetical protein